MNAIVASSLLQLVYRNSVRTCLPAIAGIMFIGWNLSQYTEGSWWLYWVVLSSLAYGFRPLAIYWASVRSSLSLRGQLIVTGAYTGLCGCAMGLCVLFTPQLPLSVRLIISLILAGFGAGSSATNAGYPPFFISYIVPLLLPLGLLWIMNPDNQLGTQVSASLGALIVMMIVLLSVLGRNTFRTFAAYVEMSERQSVLSDELSSALKQAETERARAEKSNLAKSRFIAAASHDLRQPVHVISLYTAALPTIVDNDRARGVVADLDTAVNSLSSQLNALLDISRLDAGGVQPEYQLVQINGCIEKVLSEFRRDADAKAIVLESKLDEKLYSVTDQNLLLQILRNLVGNAIKYTNQGGIILSAEAKAGFIELDIADTGMGMAQLDLEHVLDEFYQVDNQNKDKRKGLGLGLSIVDRLVNCLGYKMQIASAPGSGTTVSLVMTHELVNDDEPAVEQEFIRSVDTQDIDNLCVHIVDDDPMVRRSMSVLLEELGCRASSTGSVVETHEYLTHNKPDVVIADLRLGEEQSGIEVLNRVQLTAPDTQRVMVTGEIEYDLDQLLMAEDVNILHKPVGKDALLVLLRRITSTQLPESRA